jgi:RimJ/RimL family protein N-acetyltransferase
VVDELAEIRTARLALRRFRDQDLPTVLELQADPAAHPHEPRPTGEHEAKVLFAGWQRHWDEHGFGYVAVLEAHSRRFVGIGGVQTKELDGEPVLNLYYRFRPMMWGRGYAPEMASAVIEWAEREMPERAVVIITSTGNIPARRVADKLGFQEYRQGYYRGAQASYYRRGSPR